MTGEEALQEIKLRKDALAKQAQSNLNANYNIYSDYLSKTAQNENKGALNSYQNYPAVEGTDSTRARSAYLNRLASANDAYAEGMRGLNLYRDKLGANMDAASLNADATINGLEYKNALYNDQMAYQRERDAVADAQWQKNFDLGYLSSTGTSGGGRSYGGSGSYGGGGFTGAGSSGSSSGDDVGIFGQSLRNDHISSVGNQGTNVDAYTDYMLSLIGRGVNEGSLSNAEAAAMINDYLNVSPTSTKIAYEYAINRSNGAIRNTTETPVVTYERIADSLATNSPSSNRATTTAKKTTSASSSGTRTSQIKKNVDMTK